MSSLVIVALPSEDDLVWDISSEKVPHLTLMYLGETSENKNVQRMAEFVEHALNVNQHGPFYLDVDYRGELGDQQADVLFFNHGWEAKWIKTLRGQLLKQNDIRQAFEEADKFPEWVPHLTLGYPDAPAKELEEGRKFYGVHFDRIAVWDGNYEGPEFRLKWPERDYDDTESPVMAMSSINQVRISMGLPVADDDVVLHFGAKRDVNAIITEIEPVEDSMEHAEEYEVLEHYGVKGMRWGVRKEQVKSGAKKVGKGIGSVARFAGDVQFENMAGDGRARQQVQIDAKQAFKRTDIPALKAKPEYQEAKKLTTRMKNPRDPVVKQYRKEAREKYIQRLEEAANSHKNASGTRQYTIRERGWELPKGGGDLPKSRYFWDVTTREIEHAADNFQGTTTIAVILDDDGFITDLEIQPPTELAQDGMSDDQIMAHRMDLGESFIEGLMQKGFSEEELEHYGIKGMRWGVRKAPPEAVSPTAVSRVPHGAKRKTKIAVDGGENHPASSDAIKVAEARAKLSKSGPKALTNQELREVADRIRLEEQVKVLTSSKGSRFVRKELEGEGKNLAKKGVKKGVTKGVKRAGLAILA